MKMKEITNRRTLPTKKNRLRKWKELEKMRTLRLGTRIAQVRHMIPNPQNPRYMPSDWGAWFVTELDFRGCLMCTYQNTQMIRPWMM